jgi:hypothetical protein
MEIFLLSFTEITLKTTVGQSFSGFTNPHPENTGMIRRLLKMASICQLWQEGMLRACLKPSNLPLILTAAWNLLLYATPHMSKLLHKDSGFY